VPRSWAHFEFTFKFGASRYQVVVDNPDGVNRGIRRALLDERELPVGGCEIALIDDGLAHRASITLG
jgi:cyclic beta-1,2-glucan synthetase